MPTIRTAKYGEDMELWRPLEMIHLVVLYGMFERTAAKLRAYAYEDSPHGDQDTPLWRLANDVSRQAMDLLDVVAARLEGTTTAQEYLYATIQYRYGPVGVSPT